MIRPRRPLEGYPPPPTYAARVGAARPGPHRWDRITPATRVRVELEALRAAGVEWGEAWTLAMSEALAEIPDRSKREDWVHVLAWCQTYFRSGYERRGRIPGPPRPGN
jgi:hypothetical protein